MKAYDAFRYKKVREYKNGEAFPYFYTLFAFPFYRKLFKIPFVHFVYSFFYFNFMMPS